MAIKSILVAYSGDTGGSGGLNLALQMARKYDAHLTGVVAHGPSVFEAEYSRYMTEEVLKILRDRDANVVAEIRTGFEARVAAEGLPNSASFIDLRTRGGFALAQCARGYDIVVMGRRASQVGHEHFSELPDEVALNAGRPVILVPRDYQDAKLSEHAVLAWDGKRAAARALGDAMHILGTKKQVTVLSVGDVAPLAFGDDIVTLLQRHGIRAERLQREARRGGIARTILDTCEETGAGLLVMGAYEHSKLREELVGGVTRDILENANLPVLMSH
jgi:nucleotide-binding universal stress UspA family protein